PAVGGRKIQIADRADMGEAHPRGLSHRLGQEVAAFSKRPSANIEKRQWLIRFLLRAVREHREIDAIRVVEQLGVRMLVRTKALSRRAGGNNDPIGELVAGERARYGQRAWPLRAWGGREDLLLRQDVTAPALEPYGCAVALLREARGLEINTRHADESVAR